MARGSFVRGGTQVASTWATLGRLGRGRAQAWVLLGWKSLVRAAGWLLGSVWPMEAFCGAVLGSTRTCTAGGKSDGEVPSLGTTQPTEALPGLGLWPGTLAGLAGPERVRETLA